MLYNRSLVLNCIKKILFINTGFCSDNQQFFKIVIYLEKSNRDNFPPISESDYSQKKFNSGSSLSKFKIFFRFDGLREQILFFKKEIKLN